MSSTPAIQWALTGVFAVCVGLYVAQMCAADSRPARLAWSLHAAMALAMIAMTWPWGMAVAPIAYVLLFTAGALFFAYVGLFTTGVGHSAYHSVMMGSMVLMALAMSPSAAPGTSDSMGVMPGMNMAGGRPATGSTSQPFWATVTCGAAAVFFVGAALWSFYVLVRGPQRPVANLLMTAGMGVSFAAIAL